MLKLKYLMVVTFKLFSSGDTHFLTQKSIYFSHESRNYTARQRTNEKKYNVPEKLVLDTLKNPDSVIEGYFGRDIFQKRLNGYVLRVICEQKKGIKIVVTVYKARSERYEI
ncbi:MAG: hypothetical protein DRP97_01785 [Candidatus Latescibacterota bacterium]|nr:MAG: hypothetical protein DRP97_01785 [Candidatus Latescibacterota bacterium]